MDKVKKATRKIVITAITLALSTAIAITAIKINANEEIRNGVYTDPESEILVLDEDMLDRHIRVLPEEDATTTTTTEEKLLPSRTEPILDETIKTTESTTTKDTEQTTLDTSKETQKATETKETESTSLQVTKRPIETIQTETMEPSVTTQPTTQLTAQPTEEKKPASSNGKFLIQISNPDPNYVGRPLQVQDRAALEGLVMGEFGTDYLGSVLVAQAIRDSMIQSGTNSTARIKQEYGYTAPIRTDVTDNVKRAVAFVFDEGGSGVQHPIYYFYASNLVNSKWHETQKFITQVHAVRFFSSWD